MGGVTPPFAAAGPVGTIVFPLILLAMVTIRSFRGHFSAEHYHGMEVPGIYWHFVDVMWIFVYFTVYII